MSPTFGKEKVATTTTVSRTSLTENGGGSGDRSRHTWSKNRRGFCGPVQGIVRSSVVKNTKNNDRGIDLQRDRNFVQRRRIMCQLEFSLLTTVNVCWTVLRP